MGKTRPQREMGYRFGTADLVEAEPARLEKIQVTAQDRGADRSIVNGLDRQGVRIHRFSSVRGGLDDTKSVQLLDQP